MRAKTRWMHSAGAVGFIRLLSSIVLAISIAGPAFGNDWPQYRGVKRDGNSAETGWLKTWPPTEVWRQPVGSGLEFGGR